MENKIYNPTIEKALIVPYKQTLWAGGQEIDETNTMFIEMMQAKQNFTLEHTNITIDIVHSSHEMGRYSPNLNYHFLLFLTKLFHLRFLFQLFTQEITIQRGIERTRRLFLYRIRHR